VSLVFSIITTQTCWKFFRLLRGDDADAVVTATASTSNAARAAATLLTFLPPFCRRVARRRARD
jgi:hypothetical protein